MLIAPLVVNQLTSCLGLCVGHVGSFSLWLQERTTVVDEASQVRPPAPRSLSCCLLSLALTYIPFFLQAYRCAVIGRVGLCCFVFRSFPVQMTVDALTKLKLFHRGAAF